jgi:nucleoside-diphosphate-sugar epimerase
VLTSSFAAIGYTPKPVAEFTEADWTDPDTPGLAPYPRSKAVAERAAWDFMQREGGGTELTVVNPTFILGPTLTAEPASSLQLVKAMLDGTMTVVRRQRFGIADVRDVADLHIRAMAAPDAAGKRFLALADGPTISFLQLAEILRQRLGPLGARVSVHEAPGRTRRPWSSTTTAPAPSSAGARAPSRPRSSSQPRACATSACWRTLRWGNGWVRCRSCVRLGWSSGRFRRGADRRSTRAAA